jgi:hypothetical protein
LELAAPASGSVRTPNTHQVLILLCELFDLPPSPLARRCRESILKMESALLEDTNVLVHNVTAGQEELATAVQS